ncbi:MAG TPA: hypothetical protein PKZ49_11685 [Nitrosomonas sp.]|nr:hypothetical protein [Nitrosomonas sp.]
MASDIKKLEQKLIYAERYMMFFEIITLLLFLSVAVYAGYLIYLHDWEELLNMLPSAAPLCAALLVAKSSTRLIVYYKKIDEIKHAREIIGVTHHSYAILNDLRGRVQHMVSAFTNGNVPLLSIKLNAETIQKRYESLYDRDIYRYLPGDVVNDIGSLSGPIFALVFTSEYFVSTFEKKGLSMLLTLAAKEISEEREQEFSKTLSQLDADLKALTTKFFTIRETLD